MEQFWSYFLMFVLAGVGAFLILIVLLQRGRGGGLAGAFGGAGGQSALGTKAGDVFTKVTIGVAVVWILLAGLSSWVLKAESEIYEVADAPAVGIDDAEIGPRLGEGEEPLTDEEAAGLLDVNPFETDEPAPAAGTEPAPDTPAPSLPAPVTEPPADEMPAEIETDADLNPDTPADAEPVASGESE